MPIRPENKSRYPANWNEISYAVRQRANWRCESCGVGGNALGGRDRTGVFMRALPLEQTLHGLRWPEPGTWAWCSDGTRRLWLRIIRIVLTVAHLNHTPEDCRPENLRAWCQQCHLWYDRKHHRQTRETRERSERALGDLFGSAA